MRTLFSEKLSNPFHQYVCPRCGETYACKTEEDLFDAGTHRLLHLAGALKRSMPDTPRWLAETTT
jgi:hypothetical protein